VIRRRHCASGADVLRFGGSAAADRARRDPFSAPRPTGLGVIRSAAVVTITTGPLWVREGEFGPEVMVDCPF
jgi:hypothetical protein